MSDYYTDIPSDVEDVPVDPYNTQRATPDRVNAYRQFTRKRHVLENPRAYRGRDAQSGGEEFDVDIDSFNQSIMGTGATTDERQQALRNFSQEASYRPRMTGEFNGKAFEMPSSPMKVSPDRTIAYLQQLQNTRKENERVEDRKITREDIVAKNTREEAQAEFLREQARAKQESDLANATLDRQKTEVEIAKLKRLEELDASGKIAPEVVIGTLKELARSSNPKVAQAAVIKLGDYGLDLGEDITTSIGERQPGETFNAANAGPAASLIESARAAAIAINEGGIGDIARHTQQVKETYKSVVKLLMDQSYPEAEAKQYAKIKILSGLTGNALRAVTIALQDEQVQPAGQTPSLAAPSAFPTKPAIPTYSGAF